MVALQDVIDNAAQPHDAASGGLAFNLEGGDQIIDGGDRGGLGLGLGLGQG
jgi:hypothetical protein